jgi:hypothetical protein
LPAQLALAERVDQGASTRSSLLRFFLWFVGSTGDDGEHLQDQSGWPCSVYRKGVLLGVGDICICYGIQDLRDAEAIAGMPNTRG